MAYVRRYQKAGFVGKTLLTGIVFGAGVLAQQSYDVSGTVKDWYGSRTAPSLSSLERGLASLPDSTAYRLFRERLVNEVEYLRD